jgi:hypothetical protein
MRNIDYRADSYERNRISPNYLGFKNIFNTAQESKLNIKIKNKNNNKKQKTKEDNN